MTASRSAHGVRGSAPVRDRLRRWRAAERVALALVLACSCTLAAKGEMPPVPSAAVAASTAGSADDTLEVRASTPMNVAVTVYRDDLALVTETRRVTVPSGSVRILFEGVLDRIVPASVILKGLESGSAVAAPERNYDYSALTPRSLLWSALGEEVTVTADPDGEWHDGRSRTSERARIASAGDGILLTFADRTEALGCSTLPERITFDRVPTGLRARPTLSATLRDATAGEHVVTLSYLATGMAWGTDYTLTLSEDAAHAELSAWLTLANQSSQGFEQAEVSVIAGDLARVFDAPMLQVLQRTAQRACWPMGTTTDGLGAAVEQQPMSAPVALAMDSMVMRAMAVPPPPPVFEPAPAAQRETLQDYQLYRLPFRTDVLASQRKQVMLLQPRRIDVERLYQHREPALTAGAGRPVRGATILLRSRNDEAHGLGEPLPGGAVRLYTPSPHGAPLLTQLATVRDTPTDVDWRMELGTSPAVTVQTTVLAERTREHWFSAGKTVRRTVEHALANATNTSQVMELVQTPDVHAAGVAQVTTPEIDDATDPFVMKDGLPTWRITLPANATHMLRYAATFDVLPGSE